MEIIAFSSSDQKGRKSKADHHRRPILLLKDYLMDDLSSCSSNGFKSFPRKAHCCSTSVRFLLDVDVKGRGSPSSTSRRHRLRRSPSKAASATFSALQRASMKVLHAVKMHPFPAVKSPSSSTCQNVVRKGILPRSLSRKLSKTRFWKKAAVQVEAETETETEDSVTGRWRLFREFLEEKDPPPPPSDKVYHLSATSATSSSSWDSSDFGSSFSSNSVSSAVISDGKKDSPLPLPLRPALELEEEDEVSDRVGVTVGGEESGEGSTTKCSKEEWQNEEKEQFSPVSVLDCPFHDDEQEEVGSPSDNYSPIRIGGTKHKQMNKVHRFKSISKLEPMNLDQRLAISELKNRPVEQTVPLFKPSGFGSEAEEMLSAMKGKYPSVVLGVDNLLSDFFIEKIEEGVANHEVLNLADDWVNGREEVWLGWEIVKGRKTYLKEMEKGEVWRDLDREKHEVALEVEVEIWSSLVEEIYCLISNAF